jgi:hypothetical protein
MYSWIMRLMLILAWVVEKSEVMADIYNIPAL